MMVAMNVDDNYARQRALLLHYAGEQVYDIIETLTDTGESDDVDKACEKLTAYFSPRRKKHQRSGSEHCEQTFSKKQPLNAANSRKLHQIAQ